jgi:hypothetical protein
MAHRVIEWVNGGHLRHVGNDPGRQGSPETPLPEGTGHDPGTRVTARGWDVPNAEIVPDISKAENTITSIFINTLRRRAE